MPNIPGLKTLRAWLRVRRPERGPAMRAGEPPIRVFVSSVMSPENQGFRDTTVRALDRRDLSTTWAFEYTPASSSAVDQSYLQHVRTADIFVWLATAGTTPPVVAEVHEAIASSRRLWVVRIGENLTDDITQALIERVKPVCKMASTQDEDELADVLVLT